MTVKYRPKTKLGKREVLAQALTEGCPLDQLAARFIAAGYNEKAAAYEAGRAMQDPLFAAGKKLSNQVRKRDWTLDIYRKLQETHNGKQANIPVVGKIDPDRFFSDYYHRSQPVKLTGLIDHWPAMEKWSLDFLAGKMGNTMIELQGQRLSRQDYEIASNELKRNVTFADFVAALRRTDTSNDFYMTANNDTVNKKALAPLWDDVGDISLLKPTKALDGFFWMGPKGTITPFHHDLTNNLLLQITGRKRVTMVAPYESAHMRNHKHCFSTWQSPEQITAQGDQGPNLWQCEIGPGEALFLPVGWWHYVEALDMTIGMSFINFRADNDFYTDYPSEVDF